MHLGDILDELIEFDTTTEPADLLDELAGLVRIINAANHRAAVFTARIEQLGARGRCGRRTREVLADIGVAARWARVGAGIASLPALTRHSSLGAVSTEHADAVVKGFAHIQTRYREPLDDDMRLIIMTSLLSQQSSGASPVDITRHARALANTLCAEKDTTPDNADGPVGEPGIPAAEDHTINTLTMTPDPDGRLSVHADLTLTGAPTTSVLVMMPAHQLEQSALQFLGPVTADTARLLACDATLIGGQSVPLDVGRDKRFFTGPLRKALIARDRCCIKCGAPAAHTQGHHITAWSNNGTTGLDNGCLLCSACHTAIHADGWDIYIGADKHPWLIPPASVDPTRQPRPSYHRRTLTLDGIAA